MDTPPSMIELLFERIEAYGKSTIELSKLKALDTMSVFITSVVSRLIIFIVLTLFVVFLSIGIAIYLGEMLEKSYYGFLIVAGFYFIVGAIMHFSLYKWLKKLVSNSLSSQIL